MVWRLPSRSTSIDTLLPIGASEMSFSSVRRVADLVTVNRQDDVVVLDAGARRGALPQSGDHDAVGGRRIQLAGALAS